MKTTNFLTMISLLALVACGGGGGGGNGGGGSEREEAPSVRDLTPATPGTYYTVLRPVNFHANGFIPYGAATFTLEGDELKVSTSMDDDQRVSHRQTLHLGTRCPTMSDDKNKDGFIDYREAIAVVGKALMPLDGNLNSQMEGTGIYPSGSGMTYNMSASLASINADIWKADEDPSDDVMKLPKGKGIGFQGRVVLVHGTTPYSALPATLAADGNEEAHISLPVVCGVLKKM